MKYFKHNTRLFKTVLALIVFLHSLHAWAQIDSAMFYRIAPCSADVGYFKSGGVDCSPGSSYAPSSPATTFPDSIVMHCGKIAVYFEDVHRHFHRGFDDTTHIDSTTVGAQRRNTYCAVLTYIQSVFDFSNVDPMVPIRIYVDTSYDSIIHPSTGIPGYARAFPQYDSTTDGITNGWMNAYVTCTNPLSAWFHHDSIPSDKYHGFIQVNFDRIFPGYPLPPYYINWQNDYTGYSCSNYDLYTTLLHETCHCMGWFTLVNFTGGYMGLAPNPSITTHNVFSGMDWSMQAGTVYPATALTKLIAGTPALPYIPVAPALLNSNNYWLNNKAAPENLAVYSGYYPGLYLGTVNSYLSHLDDQQLCYTFRQRVSPGDQQEYLMGPFSEIGVNRRRYSKGELQSLVNILGYKLTAAFTAANPNIYPNHIPFSHKMAGYPITIGNYGTFTETVAPDTTITNNTGTSVTITVASMFAKNDLSDADPGDTANVYFDSTTLINFRGCSISGDNHLALKVSADAKSITYTPQPNFYGRAQWGVNITDGKERGSFDVITVNVKKGSNVSAAAATNLICNGDYEQGSEVTIHDVADNVYNSVMTEDFTHEGKWQAIHFSDSHPYGFWSNFGAEYRAADVSGAVVYHTDYNCALDSVGLYGDPWLSWPDTLSTVSSVDNPMPKDSIGYRYQSFLGIGSSFYNLADSVRHCHRYILEFDMFWQHGLTPTTLPLQIGFADTVSNLATTAPTLNYSLYTTLPFTTHHWVHDTIAFWYCGTNPSNILYINNYTGLSFSLDNLSLKEDTSTPPPLAVNIIRTPLPGCQTKFTAQVLNAECSVTYLWATYFGTTLTSTTDSFIIVPSDVAGAYYVTVNDGCRFHIEPTPWVIDSTPSAITGPVTVCVGDSITLTDSISGGAWTSGDVTKATVNIATGVVTGVGSGAVIITYTTFCSHLVTYTLTVNPTAPVTGTLIACVGTTTTLADAIPGGTWTSSNTAIATVGSGTGVVTGVAIGTVTISYALPTGCITTINVAISPVLAPITGLPVLCAGTDITLADATPGGTWTSGSTAIATVGSGTGIVHGVATGVAAITYSDPCGAYVTYTVSVSPVSPIMGNVPFCAGSSITLTDLLTGISWSVSNTTVANISTSGVVTGLAAGLDTVTFLTGCLTTITTVVTVNPLPAAITGGTAICIGGTTTLSDALAGGHWSSSNTAIAAVGSSTGVVTGLSSGTVTISYTNSCGSATVTVTVGPNPAAISGPGSVCTGHTVTLVDPTPGGTWTSGTPSVATIGSSSGVVTGILSGSSVITYTVGGCASIRVEFINSDPTPLTGDDSVCAGATTYLYNTVVTGTWVSSNTAVAAIGTSFGAIIGVSAGTSIITYTIGGGCFTTTTVTVFPVPAAISGGAASVCTGATLTLSDTSPGGVWSSGTPGYATVGSASGVVTGISPGVVTIFYSFGTGCKVSTTLTVNPSPAVITGTTNVCVGAAVVLSDATTGGTWSSSNTAIATVGSGSGVVIGVAAGTATISYILGTGCKAIAAVTVNPLPATITGSLNVCPGSTITLHDATTGGSWSSSNTAIATIGSGSGIVTGVAGGAVTITYKLPTGCYATTAFTVNPTPTITGSNKVCMGLTITLSGSSGGIWTSQHPTIATVGSASGVVTSVSVGVTAITLTPTSGCYATWSVTVNPNPLPITGNLKVCLGGKDTLYDATTGGTWASINAHATVGSGSGIITGVSTGADTIGYGFPTTTGCGVMAVIQVLDTVCAPCTVFGNHFTELDTAGFVNSNRGPGNYYVTSNITIKGTDTFTNAIILIAPYDTLFIDTTAVLTLDSTHMFSLCTAWQGMELKPGRTHSGRLFVTNHSLIEDAFCAVYIPNAVTPSSGLIFKSEASIFNRNAIGLFIQHYTPAISAYPFFIHNTVFTSRDLQTTNTHFPYQWPPTLGLGGLKNYWSPGDTFSTPFNIDDTTPGLGYSYPAVYCYGGGLPTNGIRLDSVGTNNVTGAHTGVPIPGQYYEVVIGDTTRADSNRNQNLFDALQFGIYSVNSNLTCINNVFADLFANNRFSMHPTSMGGDGIYAAETDDYVNQNRLRVYTPTGALYNNKFYNFTLGAECSNMFQVIGQHCYMMNKGFGTLFGPPSGAGGFYIKTAKYDTIDISNDTITNVTNGIAIWMAFDPTVWLSFGGTIATIPSQYMGTCNLDYNLIQIHPDWTASLSSSQHMNLGISYQNPYTYIPFGDVSTTANSLTITENTIHDAYNGIYVNNYAAPRGFHAYTNENTIYERQNGTGLPMRTQYGINNTSCFNSFVYYNSITKGTLPSGATIGTDSMRAYYAASNNGIDMGCNYETYLGRGYEFFMTNTGTNWHDNHMQNNLKGFVLNGAVIGSQYHGGTVTSPLPMNNYWDGTWSGSTPQTWVKSADAASSKFYVNSFPSSKNPSVNSGDFSTLPIYYYIPGTSIITVSSTLPDCPSPLSPITSDTPNLYTEIAQQHVNYVYNTVPNNWMAQYALWKSAVLDSTIVDSSAVVAQFVHMADSMSRFKYLTDIEYALSTGDVTTANTLLGLNIDSMANTATDSATQVKMADDVTADYIVNNYQQFYSTYIKYTTGTMVGADSLELMSLAQLCPEVNGAVVFQARALYSLVYNDLSVFNDDSCLDVDSTYFASRQQNHSPSHAINDTTQQYRLYPNPNNGSFALRQYVQDDAPVSLTVYDVTGRKLYSQQMLFTNASGNLNIADYTPGMYLLEITDSKNRIFRLKFVIGR